MKMIATATALVAALSMFGCASDNDGEGGAYLDGLRPAKPNADDQKAPFAALNDDAVQQIVNGGAGFKGGFGRGGVADDVSAETINIPFPIGGLCQICNDTIVLRPTRAPNTLLVVDDIGNFFCKIWVSDNGHVESTDCR